jgi:hypothetical protein
MKPATWRAAVERRRPCRDGCGTGGSGGGKSSSSAKLLACCSSSAQLRSFPPGRAVAADHPQLPEAAVRRLVAITICVGTLSCGVFLRRIAQVPPPQRNPPTLLLWISLSATLGSLPDLGLGWWCSRPFSAEEEFVGRARGLR